MQFPGANLRSFSKLRYRFQPRDHRVMLLRDVHVDCIQNIPGCLGVGSEISTPCSFRRMQDSPAIPPSLEASAASTVLYRKTGRSFMLVKQLSLWHGDEVRCNVGGNPMSLLVHGSSSCQAGNAELCLRDVTVHQLRRLSYRDSSRVPGTGTLAQQYSKVKRISMTRLKPVGLPLVFAEDCSWSDLLLTLLDTLSTVEPARSVFIAHCTV